MRKAKRIPIVREKIEALLKKNERRIQTIAEASYKLRQMLEQIDALKPQTPYVKAAEGETPAVAPEATTEAVQP